jgi:hypothetical protein
MTYGFRIRFRVGRVRIDSSEDVLPLTDPSLHAEDIRLGAAERDKAINETQELQVMGRAYESGADAEVAAQKWRGILEKSLARIKLGADFGRGGPTAFFSADLLAQAEAEANTKVIPDKLGITVFEADPMPLFIRLTTDGYAGRYPSHLQTIVEAAEQRQLTMSVRDQLAYELYSASFSSKDADSRFMLLMMAMETLIVQESRPPAVQGHIEQLIDATRSADLPDADTNSLVRMSACLILMRCASLHLSWRRGCKEAGLFLARPWILVSTGPCRVRTASQRPDCAVSSSRAIS